MTKIKKVFAREILNSRGVPTIEVFVETKDGVFNSGVPSGSSKGKFEAIEIEDGGKRYMGKGKLKAVKIVNETINKILRGKSVLDQKEIDELLIQKDGTQNKSRLGGNVITGVSIAVCKAGAFYSKTNLFEYIKKLSGNKEKLFIPRPFFNVINGGAHVLSGLDFQEFIISPKLKSFPDNLAAGCEIFYKLKDVIKKNKIFAGFGDEGGFVPNIKYPEQALDLINKAIDLTGYKGKVDIVLDIAASQFYSNGKYKTSFKVFSPLSLKKYYLKFISKYNIIGLEDPFSEDDHGSWKEIVKNVSNNSFMIIGDDLLVTNPRMIEKAKKENLCNSAIIKINQVGSVSEAIEAVNLCKQNNWKVIVSHRSGETNDDFIADFAVGVGADFIKTGAPNRGERVAKYNRLLEIEKLI
ncbi:Enolase [bacterium HR34]|nr:Enolase [bacterium HR34]